MDPESEMKYAPDILKALIRSKQEKGVPPELRDMANKFKEKIRSGDAVAYEGRGYKTKGCKQTSSFSKIVVFLSEKLKASAIVVTVTRI